MANIEKGIPIPPRANSKGFLPLAAMEIGDSIYAPDSVGSYKALRVRLSKENNRGLKRFTSRREGAGTRVWRVPLTPVDDLV